jgi:chromosome segregation ATPase
LAVIKNVIQTQYKSTGADKVVKDTETINRSQTRLGQASASAGRAFSSQAQGLGGLVGAYAGAAATVFALQQAFSALAKAAQSETIVRGTKTLALEIGQSGPQILRSIQSITQGQLSLTEAAQNANIALSAGFNTRQIEGFTTVALKASKALGRDFTDALQRITRGVSKLEPELLDEIGLFTRLEPAVQAYAKQLGVAASSLNEFQRRQAFANAAIEEGNRKFGNIDTTSASAQKSLEQLQVRISELGTAFGQIVVNALVPLVNFLTNNLGNSIALFGVLLGLVFKKAGQEIGGWASNSIKNLSAYANELAKTAASSKASFASISTEVTNLNKLILQRGGLSEAGGRFAQKGIQATLATEAARARQRFLQGAQLSPAEIEADRKTLSSIATQLDKNSSAYDDATAIAKVYGTALEGAGIKAKALTLISRGLTLAVNGLTIAFSFLAKAINVAFLLIGAAQLIGSLFDVDLLSKVKGLFIDLSQANENLKQGFLGLTIAAAGGSDVLIQKLKEVGATDKQLEALPKTFENLRKEVDSLANSFTPVTETLQTIEGEVLSSTYNRTVTTIDRLEAVSSLIQQAEEEIAKGVTSGFFGIGRQSQADIEALQQRVIQLQAIREQLQLFPSVYAKVVGELSRATGIGTEEIASVFKNTTSEIIKASEASLSIFGVNIQKVNDQFTLEGLAEGERELAQAGALVARTIETLNKELISGNFNITSLGSKINGLESQLITAQDAFKALNLDVQTGAELTDRLTSANTQLSKGILELRDTLNVYRRIFDEITKLEDATKSITSIFGSDISKKATVFFEGIFDSAGKIAITQEQQIANQNELLFSVLSTTQQYALQQQSIEEVKNTLKEVGATELEIAAVVASINSGAETFNKTLDAATGRIINLTVELTKLSDSFNSSVKAINLELKNLTAEQYIVDIKTELDLTNFKFSLEEQLKNLDIQQIQADISLIQAQGEAGILKALEVANKVNEKQVEIYELQVQAENRRFENVKANIAAERQLNDLNFQKEIEAIRSRKEIAINEAKLRLESLKTQALQFKSFLSGQNTEFSNFNKTFADVLTQGAAAFVAAIRDQVATIVTPDTTTLPKADLSIFDDAISAAEQSFANLEAAQTKLATAQIEGVLKATQATEERLNAQEQAEERIHNANLNRLRTEDQTRDTNHKAALKRIAEEESKKAEELRKKQAELLRDFAELVSKTFTAISSVISGIFEGKINEAKTNEVLINDSLTYTTERLNSVKEKLNSSIQRETGLRQKLTQETEALVESQTSYLESLTKQNADIAGAGKAYVENLLRQKRTILELADASRASIVLGEQVSSIEETQASLQEMLVKATESRIKKEETLRKTQELLGEVSKLVSEQINILADSLMNLGNAASMAGGGGLGQSSRQTKITIANLSEAFKPLVAGIGDALKSAVASTGTSFGLDSLAQGGKSIEAASLALSTVSNVLSTAMSGFSIGSVIGQMLGNDGVASGIGGAIGSVVATVFQTQIAGFFSATFAGTLTSALGAGLGTALGTALTFAIPVFGAIFGALLGNLFSRPAQGRAEGVLTEEGFQTTLATGRKVSGAALASIPEQALGGVVSALKAAGIEFKDTVNASVSFYKKGISGATLQFSKGLIQTMGGGTAEQVGKFFVASFFKGLRIERDEEGLVKFRSLVVNELIPNRRLLQNAIDRFAELANVTEKTQERFEQAIQFASEFNNKLIELQGPAVTAAQAIDLVRQAAFQNAVIVSSYYRNFLGETITVFGRSSEEYNKALESVQSNALAQIGLAQVNENGTKRIVSITQAQKSLNAGFLLVADAIAKATASVTLLEAAELENIAEIINVAIKTQVSEIVTTTGDALIQAVEILKNPAKAAVFSLESTIQTGADRISNLQGVLDGISEAVNSGVAISSENIRKAQQNIKLAQELTFLEVSQYLRTLTAEQLKAVISTDSLSSSIKNLAVAQLEYVELVSAQKATASLLATGRSLSKSLFDLTGRFETFRVNGLIGIGTDLNTLITNLGQTSVTPFTQNLNRALTEIANGVNITGNLNSSIAALNNELDNGNINSEQYAYGINQVIETTQNYISTLDSLQKEYQNIISQISGAFRQAKNDVTSAIQELGNDVISLVSSISSKTADILGIYDETLKSVATSGNELFNLRDSAKNALETASSAVKEFEKSNRLSGKSSEILRGEISSIQSELDNLLNVGQFDFSSFAKFSELSARQNALKRELSGLVSVEKEYEQLISRRTTAIEDLAFVEATIAGFNEDLVDTRRKESEIVQRAKDTAVEFSRSQQDLRDITILLADANFNLNQARFDEESAVSRVRVALREYNKDLTSLTSILEAVGTQSGSTLRKSFIEAAVGNASVLYADLEKIARDVKINEAAEQAANAFSQLENLVSQVQNFFTPIEDAFVDLEQISNSSISLTDRFKDFNTDLVRYLDTEGLAQFYGSGGVFEAFKNSLITTIASQGFDVLTASGGPLANFNTNLMLIKDSINTLVTSGNFLDISIQTVTTAFGTAVSAIGNDIEGLRAGFVGLLSVGQNLESPNVGVLNAYLEGIGKINASLSATGNVTFALEGIENLNKLFTNITVVDSKLGTIDFSVSANAAIANITNSINLINSEVQKINVNVGAAYAVDQIRNIFNTINATLLGAKVDTSTALSISSIENSFDAISSTLGNITIETATQYSINNLTTNISALNSTINDISITSSTESSISNINNNISLLSSTLNNISLTASAELGISNINTNIEALKSTISNLSINAAVTNSINNITTNISAVESTLSSISLNSSSEEGIRNIISNINAVNSVLSNISLNSSVEEGIGNIKTNISSIESALSNISLNSSSEEGIRNIITNINAVNSTLNNISLNSSSEEGIRNIITNIDAINSSLKNISLTASTEEGISNINTNIEALKSTINNISLNNVAAAGIDNIITNIASIESTLVGTSLDASAGAGIGNIISNINAVNSTLNNISLTASAGAGINNIRTNISSIESTLSNISLDVSTDAGIRNIVSNITAINSILRDISLDASVDSTIANINTNILAINSSLSDIDFANATASVVDKINLLANIINSSLTGFSFVDVRDSIVGEINLVTTSINSALSNINFVTARNSTISEISLVNNLINSELNDVSFVSSLNSTIQEISFVNNSINSALNNVGFITNIDGVITQINLVATNINSALNNVSYITNRNSVIEQINAINTNINSALAGVQYIDTSKSIISQINAVNINIGAALNSVNFVVSLDSTIAQINLVNLNINSNLQNVNFVNTRNSAVEQINLVSLNINSALNNVSFADTTQSVVGQINIYNESVNSALRNVTLSASTDSVVREVNTLNSAINSSLNNVSFVTSTNSSITKINALSSAINSSLDNINFVTSTNSVVGKVNTLNSTINSSLNNVSFVTSTNSVVAGINQYNTQVNEALGSISLAINTDAASGQIRNVNVKISEALTGLASNVGINLNSAASAIQSIQVNLNNALSSLVFGNLSSATNAIIGIDSNLEAALNSISFSNISSATSAIAQISAQINSALNGIGFSGLSTANSNINNVSSSINSALAGINFTNLSTAINNLTSLGGSLNSELQKVNFTNLPTAVARINSINTDVNSALANFNPSTELNAYTNSIKNTATSIKQALSASIISDTENAFKNLLAAFTGSSVSSINNFKTAIDNFANISTQINAVSGLALQINNLGNGATDSANTINTLISRFSSLQAEIQKLTGASGVSALDSKITTIATDLGNAWANIRLNTSAIPVNAIVSASSIMSLNATDSGNLKKIADNSNRYPAIPQISYTPRTFAEGGYVSGPGTETSDSIPARLSDGEYVLKASTVKKVGLSLLDTLNSSGSLESTVSSFGRYGDTKVAHLNPEEIALLLRYGGRGTRNPLTGIVEFFGGPRSAANAYGGLFPREESAYLQKIAQQFPTGTPTLQNSLMANYISTQKINGRYTNTVGNPLLLLELATGDIMSTASYDAMQNEMLSSTMILDTLLQKRGFSGVNRQTQGFGMDSYRAPKKRNIFQKLFGLSKPKAGAVLTGDTALDNDINLLYSNVTAQDLGRGGYDVRNSPANQIILNGRSQPASTNLSARYGEAASTMLGSNLRNPTDLVNLANARKELFFDFYMLENFRMPAHQKAAYSARSYTPPPPPPYWQEAGYASEAEYLNNIGYVSGGLIKSQGGSYNSFASSVKGPRDSVPTMLQPGEFVLRKSAVDRMGLDAANKLNATGDIGGDTNVEVNITNNGNPVNVAATPEIRRENGKIVLDIILEDIRNNGPIRQQIRSIR